MLLGTNKQIDHLIVTLFESVSEWTAQELHQEICTRYRDCTLRAIYKELHKLIDDGIVVNTRGTFSLNSTWILNLARFTQGALNASLSPSTLEKFLPQHGMKKKWQFTDLHTLDRFWVQLLFTTIQVSQSGVQFNWLPHYWFHLLSPTTENTISRALRTLDKRGYTIFNSGTYLERLDETRWDKQLYRWAFPPHQFEGDPSKYIGVIDTYIFTIKLDAKTMRRIDQMFTAITSKNTVNYGHIKQTIDSKVRCSFTLENSRRKSSVLRKRFCDHFKIDDPYIEN